MSGRGLKSICLCQSRVLGVRAGLAVKRLGLQWMHRETQGSAPLVNYRVMLDQPIVS